MLKSGSIYIPLHQSRLDLPVGRIVSSMRDAIRNKSKRDLEAPFCSPHDEFIGVKILLLTCGDVRIIELPHVVEFVDRVVDQHTKEYD